MLNHTVLYACLLTFALASSLFGAPGKLRSRNRPTVSKPMTLSRFQ